MSRRAQNCDSSLNLVQVIITWEERSATYELRKDASDGPAVKSVSVMGRIENNLRGSIPSCDNVFSKSGSRFFITSSETKIANLKVTILIEK